MKWAGKLAAIVAFAVAWRSAPCYGHGTPIVVNVASNKLVVSGGVPDATGYANWVFADPDSEAWLTPGPGPTQLSTLPGFDVNDMQVGEALSLEIISRPDFSRAGRPPRWLWHWNGAAEEVTLAADDPALELVSSRGFLPNVSLAQTTPPGTPTIKLANILDTDVGEHRHMILYKLSNSPTAELGVYGFFARLKSPGYESSDPFLIALNNGLEDFEPYQEGALAINAAAGLAGDFDVDGHVDGDDLLAWQRGLSATGAPGVYPAADGSLDGVVNAADLAIWRSEYGRVVMYPPAATGGGIAVPEPCGLALGLIALAAFGVRRSRRRREIRRGRASSVGLAGGPPPSGIPRLAP